jgi:hypothetical protein
MTQPVVIVGGALAGLVAAAELNRRGQDVTLVNTGGPWGGYFAGIEAGGQLFDAGMVILEFTAFAEQAGREALATYDPAVRNDAGRFAALVGAWLGEQFESRVIETPRMIVEGRNLPDLIMGNAMQALRDLPFADAARRELASLPDPGPLHGRHKAQGTAYDAAGFEAASRANHGAVLQERLITPFLDKVFGAHAGHLLARYHRIPWLPLYWPETLLAVLDGQPPPFEPTPLSYPAGSTVAAEVRRLAAELATSPHVQMIEGGIRRVTPEARGGEIELFDGQVLRAANLAWANAPSALLGALGEAPAPNALRRAPLALGLFLADTAAVAEPFSVTQILDPATVAYRVTDLDACAGEANGARRWVVEINLDVLAARYGAGLADDAILAHLAAELEQVGLAQGGLKPLALRRVPGGFAVPDGDTLAAWSAEREQLARLAPGVELMAASAGFMTTSLSDQVLQGLKFADSLEGAR